MASRGVNKVILLGNVGANPDVRTFQSGDMVANFSLATSETWNDKTTGQERERTEWHRCVAYRGLASVIQRFVRKGSKIYVEGRLQTRKWQDQNGIERYTTEIIVDNMQMLDSKNSSTAPFDEASYENSSSFDNARSPSNYPKQNNAYGNSGNYGHASNENYGNDSRAYEDRAHPKQERQAPLTNSSSYKNESFDESFSDRDDAIPF